MSRFFAGSDSDSDSESELSSSRSSSGSSHSSKDDNEAPQASRLEDFLRGSDSESEEEERRVVKSVKQKQYEAVEEYAVKMRNHMKIQDWVALDKGTRCRDTGKGSLEVILC